MGLEEVKAEINEKAERESKKLISEAKKEADQIRQESKNRIKEYKEKREVATKKTLDNMEKLALTETDLEIQKRKFQAKKEIIDGVFDLAIQRLSKSKKKKDYIQKLLKKAKSELNVKKIYCNKNDSANFKGVKVEIALVNGGFIAENANGTISVDYTFGTLMDDIKEKKLSEVAGLLF